MLNKEIQDDLIAKGRAFMRGYKDDDPYADFESDQDLKLPQPPLVKAAVSPAENHISLTKDFTRNSRSRTAVLSPSTPLQKTVRSASAFR